MLRSKINSESGKPILYIDGVPTTAMAYTTYFDERSRHEDFINAGYRIFFVNASFTTLPINTYTAFSPFRVGIFENADKEDYSEFENAVRSILSFCPDAIIFPRINISMPRWWVEAHPDDVTPVVKGGYREALASEAFRRDGASLLLRFIKHVRSAEYSDRIGGWQICGGMTQEWFHFDYCGGICNAVRKPYRDFVKERYGTDDGELPNLSDYLYTGVGYNESENLRRYSLFTNLEVAKTVDHFAKTVKEATDREQVVGVFYGYSFECNQTVLFGSHALRALIDSENLDFFSSPNAYTNNRAFGIDWADMMPVDSLRLHGKLCFMECDIRTYLTRAIQEVRPGEYPDGIYRTTDGTSVWKGPPTLELSVEAIRKCFIHQLTKGSAIWWFDMWGGWYEDGTLMRELEKMKRIYDSELTSNSALLPREVVLFADESAYAQLFNKSPQLDGIGATRTAIGSTGVPYDTYMVEDAPRVLAKYKAAVFAMPTQSDAGNAAIALCKQMEIPFIRASIERPTLSEDEIIDFLKKHDVHFYTDEKDVAYVGNGYVGLHAASGGEKLLKLPRPLSVTPIFGADADKKITDSISFRIEKNASVLFKIEEVES